MKRRTLLGFLVAGSASTAMAQGWPQGLPRIGRRLEKEVLILLELRGGNDGFNTVIPVEEPLYHQARPTLAIRDGIPLRDGLALHPELDPALAGDNEVLRQLLELEQAGQRELQRLREALQPLSAGLKIPRSGLGQQVALALQLIGSEACPPVLQLAQGGYDTHANQAGRQAQLLKQLAEAVVALDAGLRRMPRRPQVRLITVSEFGRRLQENSTRGTDHGSASVALVYGEPGQASFHGGYPNLEGVHQIRPGASLLPDEGAHPPSAPSWLDLLRRS